VALPDEGPLQLGAVTLPAGRWIRPQEGDGSPVAWVTETTIAEPGALWAALSELHPETGLAPILLPAGRGNDFEESCRTSIRVEDVDRVAAAAPLEARWSDLDPGQRGEDEETIGWTREQVSPFTVDRFPGLAPAVTARLDRDRLAAAVHTIALARIALVPAARPADALPVLGWCPGNWFDLYGGQGVGVVPSSAGFAAVLRSWEDRFGARLFAMTHDEAYLLVTRPPRDPDAALRIAAEHHVFCDEPAGRQPIRQTAKDLASNPLWYFWWD
jgi:hypothetical protein